MRTKKHRAAKKNTIIGTDASVIPANTIG